MAVKKRDRLQEVIQECYDELIESLDNVVEYFNIQYYQREDKIRHFSPIETMFVYKFSSKYVLSDNWIPEAYEIECLDTRIWLLYSEKVQGKSGKFYYPDFTFNVMRGNQVVYDNMKILIELDGHIWHEKTPDKVEKDKIRERDLIDNGYTLYRFSGREVHKDVEAIVDTCINRYVKAISKHLKEQK